MQAKMTVLIQPSYFPSAWRGQLGGCSGLRRLEALPGARGQALGGVAEVAAQPLGLVSQPSFLELVEALPPPLGGEPIDGQQAGPGIAVRLGGRAVRGGGPPGREPPRVLARRLVDGGAHLPGDDVRVVQIAQDVLQLLEAPHEGLAALELAGDRLQQVAEALDADAGLVLLGGLRLAADGGQARVHGRGMTPDQLAGRRGEGGRPAGAELFPELAVELAEGAPDLLDLGLPLPALEAPDQPVETGPLAGPEPVLHLLQPPQR